MLKIMNKKDKLNKLKEKAASDNNLPLKSGATNLVFGVGNPECKFLFIGEGPGHWEDVKGEPFVGNAGALLNQLLQSIKLPRENVFITNIVMHRPPGNRDPQPFEIEAYKPYIDGIIDIINPKVVVTLGRFSMGKFLPGAYISDVHGKTKVVEYQGRSLTVVPMYHPAAGLRRIEIKEYLKSDFAKLPEVLKEVSEKSRENVKMEKEVKQTSLF